MMCVTQGVVAGGVDSSAERRDRVVARRGRVGLADHHRLDACTLRPKRNE